MNRDVVSGAGLLLLSIAYLVAARGLPPGRDEPGPAFFPMLLGSFLCLLAIAIFVRGWRTMSGETRPRSLVLIGITFLYALAFSWVGFAVATAFYSAGIAWGLGRRRWGVVAISAAATISIYLIFGLGLGVPLP